MAFCTKASTTSKIAFVLLFPALGIHCAGYGTMKWMKSELVSGDVDSAMGLWRMENCTSTPCIVTKLPDTYRTMLLYFTRGLMAVPIVLISFAIILGLFYVTSPAARTQKAAAWIMMLLFVSVGVTLVGAILWTINVPSKHFVYWSFGLTIIAAAICVVSATLLIKDIRQFDYDEMKRKKAEKKRKKKLKKERQLIEEMDLYNDRY